MNLVASIVEGDGEVSALPVLLRRIANWQSPDAGFEILRPIRVRRDRFLNKDEEFNRVLKLAALKCGESGWILILLDADDDCPAQMGINILEKARAVVAHRRVSVVFAKREYEAWFLAAACSLNGIRGFTYEDLYPPEAENIRGAKEWSGKRMQNKKYREITDQPAFSAKFDLSFALQNSRSFRKLCEEWKKNMDNTA